MGVKKEVAREGVRGAAAGRQQAQACRRSSLQARQQAQGPGNRMFGCGCCENASSSLLGLLIALYYGNAWLEAAAGVGNSNKQPRLRWFFVWVQALLLLASLALAVLALSTTTQRFFFAKLCGVMSQGTALDSKRCELLSAAKGRVLEIGPGSGVNFRCLAHNQSVKELHLVEPNAFFEPSIRLAAKQARFPVIIHSQPIETFSPSAQFDVVLGTHVLCSVSSLTSTLNVISESLAPGGSYLLFEHVLAEQGTFVWVAQQLLQPFFFIIGAGCTFRNLIQDVPSVLATTSGFDFDLKPWTAPLPIPLLQPHLVGTITKRRS